MASQAATAQPTTVTSASIATGVGRFYAPKEPVTNKRGYSSVGKNIFAMDTEKIKQMRDKNIAKKKREQMTRKRP